MTSQRKRERNIENTFASQIEIFFGCKNLLLFLIYVSFFLFLSSDVAFNKFFFSNFLRDKCLHCISVWSIYFICFFFVGSFACFCLFGSPRIVIELQVFTIAGTQQRQTAKRNIRDKSRRPFFVSSIQQLTTFSVLFHFVRVRSLRRLRFFLLWSCVAHEVKRCNAKWDKNQWKLASTRRHIEHGPHAFFSRLCLSFHSVVSSADEIAFRIEWRIIVSMHNKRSKYNGFEEKENRIFWGERKYISFLVLKWIAQSIKSHFSSFSPSFHCKWIACECVLVAASHMHSNVSLWSCQMQSIIITSFVGCQKLFSLSRDDSKWLLRQQRQRWHKTMAEILNALNLDNH